MKTFLLPLLLMDCALRGAIAAQAQSIYEPYTFSEFAGFPGIAGSNDGAANAARFNYPSGVAVDGAGNLYVAETASHTIRKIPPLALSAR